MLIEVTRPPMEFVVASSVTGQWHVLYVWDTGGDFGPTLYVAVGTITKLKKHYRAVRADYFTAAAYAKTYKYYDRALRMLVAEAVFDFLEGPDVTVTDVAFCYSEDDMHLFFRDSAVKVNVAANCKDYVWEAW